MGQYVIFKTRLGLRATDAGVKLVCGRLCKASNSQIPVSETDPAFQPITKSRAQDKCSSYRLFLPQSLCYCKDKVKAMEVPQSSGARLLTVNEYTHVLGHTASASGANAAWVPGNQAGLF